MARWLVRGFEPLGGYVVGIEQQGVDVEQQRAAVRCERVEVAKDEGQVGLADERAMQAASARGNERGD